MIPIPHGQVAFNGKEAYFIARKFGHEFNRKFVIKAQVQAPARTKGVFRENGFKGGIHIVESIDEVRDVADQMCGKHLVTLPYTTTEGFQVSSVLVMEYI